MSDMTFVEKRKFEQLLGMSTGYVLDFSNRRFADFVLDSTGIDIYSQRYEFGGNSKANRLRAFWQKETNAIVGKLMGDMLDYLGESGPSHEVCRLIVARLLHGVPTVTVPQHTYPTQPPSFAVPRGLMEDFSQLTTEKDRNKAGFALEKLLNCLFDAFRLHPRQPFRVPESRLTDLLSWTGKSTC